MLVFLWWLLMLGWIRCGNILYYPVNSICCCPHFQIRLNVNDFVLDKRFGKVVRKTERYLNGVRKKGSKKKVRQKRVSDFDQDNEDCIRNLLQECADDLRNDFEVPEEFNVMVFVKIILYSLGENEKFRKLLFSNLFISRIKNEPKFQGIGYQN